MENKLIPLTEFVNRIDELVPAKDYEMDYDTNSSQLNAIKRYAKFLSQPLTLSMFVPCDDEGNVLEEPELYSEYKPELGGTMNKEWKLRCEAYNEAKLKVLFEGFVYIAPWYGNHIVAKDKLGSCQITFNSQNNVGKILYETSSEITLSPTALKQIYG